MHQSTPFIRYCTSSLVFGGTFFAIVLVVLDPPKFVMCYCISISQIFLCVFIIKIGLYFCGTHIGYRFLCHHKQNEDLL